MKEEPLVSIISPCYNGEKYLSKFLSSLLEQDYKNIEFIFVNDGSSDKTENIFLSFKPKLENKGWDVFYFKQKNAGAAEAINVGLTIFKGKYLTWPDSDDILYSNYISTKVNYMEKNTDCDLLFSVAEIVNDKNPNDVKGYLKCNSKLLNDENIFESFVFGRNMCFAPICSFIRSSSFLEINPTKKIYNNGHGQNWQMLLPLVYNCKVGFIDDILACYVEHSDSHSHNKNTEYKRLFYYENILLNTIDSISNMQEVEKKLWKKKIKKQYLKLKLKYKIKESIKFCFGNNFFNFIKRIK